MPKRTNQRHSTKKNTNLIISPKRKLQKHHSHPRYRKTSSRSFSKTDNKEPSFDGEILGFTFEIECVSLIAQKTSKSGDTSKAMNQICNKVKEFSKTVIKKREFYKVEMHSLEYFCRCIDSLMVSMTAKAKMPEILLCALIHQYDAYLGKLLRVVFSIYPEKLKTSQKQMTYSDLSSFNSLDEARDYIAEKEIETVLRDNHRDQFQWMERVFGVVLRKDLHCWPQFVEITERRNLIAHCGGRVSSQYLTVCKHNNVKFDKVLKPGDKLYVSPDYFDRSYECVFEIGVKLGQVVWRIMKPDDLESADSNLILIAYDLLCKSRYTLAITILTFGVEVLKDHSSDESRRLLLINLALAHYLLGEKEKATCLLDNDDWSSCSDKFKLAVAVLHENYVEAARIMRRIGHKGDVTQENYALWPLFNRFRKSHKFVKTYKSIFGQEYIIPTDTRGVNAKELEACLSL